MHAIGSCFLCVEHYWMGSGLGFLRCFQKLRSYCDEIETGNKEEISFSSQRAAGGLLAAGRPYYSLLDILICKETKISCIYFLEERN